jgi:tRNA pseudouridine55 synthase
VAAGRHGVIVVDKPAGMTSARAVDVARARVGADRAGHGGTLDPLATGVLAIAVGSATKLAGFLLSDDKAYVADCVFGVATDTLDRAGAVVAERPWQHVDERALLAALAARVGEQDQVPPMYSAIKVDGVRLHERARAGEDIDRAPRRVRVDALELVAWAPPRARIAIACGKGTYVRSLLADLAADLGTVAHMAELRRTRAGRYTIEQAVPLDALSPDTPRVPIEDISNLPSVLVPEHELRLVMHAVQLAADRLAPAMPARCQLVDASGTLCAVVHVDDRGRVIYDRVFPELFR